MRGSDGGPREEGCVAKKRKRQEPRVNIAVTIAVHPKQGDETGDDVSVEVGQADFTYGETEDEEEDEDDE